MDKNEIPFVFNIYGKTYKYQRNNAAIWHVKQLRNVTQGEDGIPPLYAIVTVYPVAGGGISGKMIPNSKGLCLLGLWSNLPGNSAQKCSIMGIVMPLISEAEGNLTAACYTAAEESR